MHTDTTDATVTTVTTVTARVDGELLRKARVVCAHTTQRLVAYLDAAMRDKIESDYERILSGLRDLTRPANRA